MFEVDPVRHMARHLDLVRAGWRMEDVFRSRWLAVPEAAAQMVVEQVLAAPPREGSGRDA